MKCFVKDKAVPHKILLDNDPVLILKEMGSIIFVNGIVQDKNRFVCDLHGGIGVVVGSKDRVRE